MDALTASRSAMSTKVVLMPHFAGRKDLSRAKVPPAQWKKCKWPYLTARDLKEIDCTKPYLDFYCRLRLTVHSG